MSKYGQLLVVVLFLLITPAFVLAIEVKPEDYGAIVDDGIDDSAAIQACVDAIFLKGGGKILLPSGRLNIQNPIDLQPPGYVGAEIKFQGSQGSVLEISVGRENIAFKAANLNILTFEETAFVGKIVPPNHPDFYDAKYLLLSDYVSHTNISRCQFYNLAVPNNAALIYLKYTDARISDSQFDGDLAEYPNGAVILAENPMGLTVSRTSFIDFANFHGAFLTKTPAFVGSWIKVKGDNPMFNALGLRRVVIEDSRFDEGAATAITIENIPWVSVSGISVNVNSTDVGRGIFMKNVDYAGIRQSWFGLATQPRPALDLENVGVEVTALQFDSRVYFLKQFRDIKVTINYCPQCVAQPDPVPAAKVLLNKKK